VRQARGVSGLEMASVVQKKIFVLLCDYRCASEDMQEGTTPIDAQLASE
jgi:hypothetical protein